MRAIGIARKREARTWGFYCIVDFIKSVFTDQKSSIMILVSKDAQCSETDFWVFFCQFLHFELWSILYSKLVLNWGLMRTLFRNANQWYPIISWLGVFNTKKLMWHSFFARMIFFVWFLVFELWSILYFFLRDITEIEDILFFGAGAKRTFRMPVAPNRDMMWYEILRPSFF